jgi:hypothetical protein
LTIKLDIRAGCTSAAVVDRDISFYTRRRHIAFHHKAYIKPASIQSLDYVLDYLIVWRLLAYNAQNTEKVMLLGFEG